MVHWTRHTHTACSEGQVVDKSYMPQTAMAVTATLTWRAGLSSCNAASTRHAGIVDYSSPLLGPHC